MFRLDLIYKRYADPVGPPFIAGRDIREAAPFLSIKKSHISNMKSPETLIILFRLHKTETIKLNRSMKTIQIH
jgi:hypothetical protein